MKNTTMMVLGVTFIIALASISIYILIQIYPEDLGKKYSRLCDKLSDNDYFYDCTEWGNKSEGYDSPNLPDPIWVKCEQKSKTIAYDEQWGHPIDCAHPNVSYIYHQCVGENLTEAMEKCESAFQYKLRILYPEEK